MITLDGSPKTWGFSLSLDARDDQLRGGNEEESGWERGGSDAAKYNQRVHSRRDDRVIDFVCP